MALASPVFALLDDACAPAAVDLAQGLHLVLLADYESGVRLAGLQGPPGTLRLLRFRHCERLTRAGVEVWLAQQEGTTTPGPAGVIGLTPDDDEATYTAALAEVHARIRAGAPARVVRGADRAATGRARGG